ncbi:MAG: glycosyltransferase family 4 protein [Clostridia bacterium]|nr:glycosyltransferase family 4 protein [Clostridia bacterium]
MKILFMIPRLTYSGAPKMMAWVANQMAEKGHEVHLLTFFSEEQARILHEYVTVHSLKVAQSKSRLVRNTTGMLKIIIRLHKMVRQLKPDIVVSFLDSVGYVYLPIGRFFTKSKYIVSERVDPYSYKGMISKIRFFLMKYAHGYVFQTEGSKSFFDKYSQIHSNSVVIPNPVVINETVLSMQKDIPSYDEREQRIVTVGRLSLKQKRQDVLLESFKIFHEKFPEYKLEIYGDGQDKDRIQEIINTMGLSNSVILVGRTEKIEEKIFNAAAFVLTSDYEGIPNALIEALSVGVPSVSTDCSPGGAALLIRNGENGFLVPCGNAKAIADKLSLIVGSKEISERFSKNSPAITEEFAESIIADKWEACFERVRLERAIHR